MPIGFIVSNGSLQTNKFNMVCQILDVLYIYPLRYLSDPTDPITCLRPHLIITPTPFGIATPGLGTPDLENALYFLRIDFSHVAPASAWIPFK